MTRNELARAIIRAMEVKGYKVDRGAGEANIVYVEGMNLDGTRNDDAPDYFNDLRAVIRFVNGQPEMAGLWKATTEPGKTYTLSPVNPGGAARIQFGQYRAWQVGIHKDHEALVQTGGSVTVCRDKNKDYKRTGDKLDTGYFGINQHGPRSKDESDKTLVGSYSAGCLVANSMPAHREFMRLIKTDKRFLANNQFVFTTAVLTEDDVLAAAKIMPAPKPTPQPVPPAQFERSLPLLLESEGGNDDDPRDPGGRTSRGITQNEWDAWRRSHPGLPSDVWKAPDSQVRAIYRANYWDVLRCDELPHGIDYAVFDFGVNSGNSRAAKHLQKIVGVAQDGKIGPLTIEATRAYKDQRELIRKYQAARLATFKTFNGWATFGKGWTNRINCVERDALAMVENGKPAVAAAPLYIPKPGFVSRLLAIFRR